MQPLKFKTLLYAACLLFSGFAVTPLPAAVYLLTFDAEGTTYTTDGTNTWNTITADKWNDPTPHTGFGNTGFSTSLLDTTGADLGVDFATVETPGKWFGDNAGNATSYPSLSWFNSSVAEQTSFMSFNDSDNTGNTVWSFKLTGLTAGQTVDVQWIASRDGSGTRSATFTVGGNNANVISGNAVFSVDFVTNTNPEQFMEWMSIAPDGSGEVVFAADWTGDNSAAFANAIRVAVVPEPSTGALLLGASVVGLVVRRRR